MKVVSIPVGSGVDLNDIIFRDKPAGFVFRKYYYFSINIPNQPLRYRLSAVLIG
jgi:hypothetical protein